MADEMPEPITELAGQAAQLHELYLAFLEAGFAEAPAFELVKAVLVAPIQGGTDGR
jgi:hypothetical protein